LEALGRLGVESVMMVGDTNLKLVSVKYPNDCPCGISARDCDYHKDAV
jgi:hypothetical protein